MGYATTVMQQRGPSHAVGYKTIEARSVLSRSNQCACADGKVCPKSNKNEFHVPLTSPTSLEMLKNPHYAQNPSMSAMAFYEKVIKVKADVAAFLINCFPSA